MNKIAPTIQAFSFIFKMLMFSMFFFFHSSKVSIWIPALGVLRTDEKRLCRTARAPQSQGEERCRGGFLYGVMGFSPFNFLSLFQHKTVTNTSFFLRVAQPLFCTLSFRTKDLSTSKRKSNHVQPQDKMFSPGLCKLKIRQSALKFRVPCWPHNVFLIQLLLPLQNPKVSKTWSILS